jgi:hypothetical protein
MKLLIILFFLISISLKMNLSEKKSPLWNFSSRLLLT